ncbi:RDD family protein [Flaviaesturariibacter amylovorans]|uniref:RDD domain-containing protein n=1 Tax=Flaviaesturariibacter amylovorans TaxID=1084520 RepID=A0ABP8G415_9BACT
MSTTTVLETKPLVYPTLSDRIQSTFIDSILIVVMMFFAASALEQYEGAPDWIRVALFFGIWGVYEPVCTALGCTVGNYFKGIRVRRASDKDRKINLLQAFFRYLLKIGLGWVSFLTMHTNTERRAIHDIVAGSVVLKNNA